MQNGNFWHDKNEEGFTERGGYFKFGSKEKGLIGRGLNTAFVVPLYQPAVSCLQYVLIANK